MRNLKRVLSLAMASIMLVGMMMVGASAVDFPDSDKIENSDAVNTMVSLGIIKGKDDGNFDPEGIVTRAEMAKMICVALNGGRDPNLGNGGGIYPDTKGHWAAGYIDFCANRGIVSGDNKGNFNPNNTVTGTEAAKMILIALGYNAETEKFVNDAKWDININVLASTVGLYDNVAINSSEGLTRDNAAQMLYDGMQAKMVKYEMVGIINGNGVSQAVEINPSKTILSDKFSMQTGYSYLTAISYDSDKEEYEYTLSDSAEFGSAAITGTEKYADTVQSANDYSTLFGQQVKTLYKVDNGKTTVYGMYASDSSVLVSDVVGNISTVKATDTSVKVDGTSYKLTDKANVTPVFEYNNGEYEVSSTAQMLNGNLSAAKAYKFDLIDNTGDGKGDVVVVYPVSVAKVTYVGKDSITAGNVSYKFDDCDIYEDVAKDDYAVITKAVNTANDTVVITEAEIVTGTVEAEKTSDNQYRVDGTWYTKDANASISISAGDEVEMTVVNGYIFAAKVTEGSATLENVIYVIDSANHAATDSDQVIAPSLGGAYKGADHLILMADGTKSTVKAQRVDVMKIVGTNSTVADRDDDTVCNVEAKPGLYTYKVNKDGVYELKAVKIAGAATDSNGSAGSYYVTVAANQPSSTTFGTGSGSSNVYTKTAGKLDGKFIGDDAVIYLVDTANSKYKVVSGKELKTMQDYGDTASYLTKKVSGLVTVQVAVLVDNAAYSGTDLSTGYGYVTEAGYAEKNADGDWTVKFTAWTDEGERKLTATDVTAASDAGNPEYLEGAFIVFTNTATTDEITDADVIIQNYTPANPGNNVKGAISGEVAISGYDGDKNIAFTDSLSQNLAAQFKDNDKSVVIFVDTANNEGIEGGSIEMAQELTSGSYVMNAVTKVTAGEVDVLFVDTANKLSGATYKVASVTANTISNNSITYTPAVTAGNAALNANDTVKAGTTLTVTVTPSGNAAAAGSKVITVTMTMSDGTTSVQTMTFTEAQGATPAVQSVSFSMPDQNVTSIVVS